MTRADVFAFIWSQPTRSCKANALLQKFGVIVIQALSDLIELGMVYEYQRSDSGTYEKYRQQIQMFGVCQRWQ